MNFDLIKDKFDVGIIGVTTAHDEITVTVAREILIPLLRFLKEEEEFACDFLTDLCGVDYLPQSPRFQVVYHLYSLKHKHRLRVKVAIEERDPVVDSCLSLWAGADWLERECFDLFGIIFNGHPNLQRILLPTDFAGHPLRKDFPLEGIKEQ
ncbi:MAG: NADH-quinone oxidoreductase subunit C [Syntrophales bacterium]